MSNIIYGLGNCTIKFNTYTFDKLTDDGSTLELSKTYRKVKRYAMRKVVKEVISSTDVILSLKSYYDKVILEDFERDIPITGTLTITSLEGIVLTLSGANIKVTNISFGTDVGSPSTISLEVSSYDIDPSIVVT